MGRGRKTCPNCNTEMGARTYVCSCGYDFTSAKKEKETKKREAREIKKENKVKEVKEIKEVKKPELTLADKILRKEALDPTKRIKIVTSSVSPKENAERILSYGKERASNLLKQHECGQTWAHVDWELVKEGI